LHAILCPLPYKINGCVKETVNDEPACILNSPLTRKENIETYKHALKHENDFGNVEDVSKLEKIRHK